MKQIITLMALLIYFNIGLSTQLRASNKHNLETILSSKIDIKYILLSSKIKNSNIDSISNLSKSKRRTMCNKINSIWDEYWSEISKAPQRSSITRTSIFKMLKIKVHACDLTPKDFYPLLNDLSNRSNQHVRNLLRKDNVLLLLPKKITGFSESKGIISFDKYFKWLFDETNLAAFDDSCSNISNVFQSYPKSENCMAEWIFKRTYVGQKIGKNVPKKLLNEYASKIERILTSTQKRPMIVPTFYAYIFENLNRNSKTITRKLLNSDSSAFVGKFIANNGRNLNPLINLNEARSSVSCEKMTEIASEGFKNLSATGAMAKYNFTILGKLLFNSCPTELDHKKLMNITKNIPRDYHYESNVTGFKKIELLTIETLSFEDDLFLKENLGLNFHYGSYHDLIDIKNNKLDTIDVVVDSIIASYLRSVDTSPWVRVVENIEDIEFKNKLTTMILLKLGQLNFKGRRFLQNTYLNHYDFAPYLDHTSSGNIIRQIREKSAYLAAVIPSFIEINLEIHNGINKSIIERVEHFQKNMNISELQQYGNITKDLVELLKDFFRIAADPIELTDVPLKEILKKDTHLYKVYSKKIQLIKKQIENSEPSRKILESTLKLTSRIYNEVISTEVQLLAGKSINEQWIKSNIDISTVYVNQVRILNSLHMSIVRYIQKINDRKTLKALKSKYINYINNYFEATDATSNINDIYHQISQSIQKQFQRRVPIFNFFMTVQSRREVPNDDYVRSIHLRQYSLQFLTEKILRDTSIQNLNKFQFDDQNNLRVLNPGKAKGFLKYVKGKDLATYNYKANEIIISEKIPLNLGVVAGLITETRQNMFSHVDLRTKERNVPNVYLKDAAKKYSSLIGKAVEIEVEGANISIIEINPIEIRQIAINRSIIVPKLDLSVQRFVDMDYEDESKISIVGAKAFGYAKLRKIFGEHSVTPKGYAIPFFAYNWFVKKFNIDKKINSFLESKEFLSPEEISTALNKIRSLFKINANSDEFLDSDFYDDLVDLLMKLEKETTDEGHDLDWTKCFRFRSSTNSEDLVDFTGAGLYSSKTGCLSKDDRSSTAKILGFIKQLYSDSSQNNNSAKTVGKALGKVWGSLWNDEAFYAREYNGISHKDVKMAVLIHRNYPIEHSNGVLLTQSRIDSSSFISINLDEHSVTNPDGESAGDEIEASLTGNDLRIINATYANPEQPTVSHKDMKTLLLAGKEILYKFRQIYKEVIQLPTMRMDIEFKFLTENDGSKRLIIKQARPFFQRL